MNLSTRAAVRAWGAACVVVAIAGCSTTYTVDDGSPVDEKLFANINLYGRGERLLRPAIERSGQLTDVKQRDCSTQWEIPFSVASSYDLDRPVRIAWVRALQVDERLSVISATPESGLTPGDKIVELDGYGRSNTTKMLTKLEALREDGDPFVVKTAQGKEIQIKPFKVCRGYTRLSPPDKPFAQDFHWLKSVHALEIFNAGVTPDEALWMVLWTQGLSEEGGLRMKTFHYTKETVLTALDIATYAVAIGGIAQAGKAAANQVMTSAGEAMTKAASDQIARQALESAGKEAAKAAAREYVQRGAEEFGKAVVKQTGVVVAESFATRVGFSISMLSRVATTAFDEADLWAYNRMPSLGADSLAGATLHRKLVDQNLIFNAFSLDEERMTGLVDAAKGKQLDEAMKAAFIGLTPAASLEVAEMPEASRDIDINPQMDLASAIPAAGEMPSESDK